MTSKFFSGAAFALAACCSSALLAASAAEAANFSAEYVFGDSLSDNGNLAAGLGVTFPTRRASTTASPTVRWRFNS
jgi:phospholipase/lecithinase/hemolysin